VEKQGRKLFLSKTAFTDYGTALQLERSSVRDQDTPEQDDLEGL
jgi:hypothetical protein